MNRVERDARVRKVFAAVRSPVVIDKGLARVVPELSRVPRYVAEFLLAAKATPQASPADVVDVVTRMYPVPEDRAAWRHRLVEEGELRLLDEVEVQVDVRYGTYFARLASLDLVVLVDPGIVRARPQLLAGGLWGRCELVREPDPVPDREGRTTYSVHLREFHPVQVRASLDPFVDNRYYFATADWIDLLLTSAGYDPDVVSEDCAEPGACLRRKLLLLSRLAPAVEPRVHLLELGPRNTGKTYLLRSLSGRVFVMSGGRSTPASLFVNLTSRTPGILVQRSVVVFDEVARLHLGAADTLATMKDFLAEGRFSRGSYEYTSPCSTVFLGNIDVDQGQPARRYATLVDPLPLELRDAAFIDRLCGYLPGWELPKMRPESFATGVGFISDYFGEALVRLRDLPFEAAYRDAVGERTLLDGATERDRAAIERLARALIKLVFPHGRFDAPGDDEVIAAILALAGELRQRIHNVLVGLAPGEFAPRRVGFSGVADSSAPDLTRALRPSRTASLSTAPGAAYYLDIGPEGMEGDGELRAIEVSVLPSPGLRVHGPAAVTRVARLVHDHVKTHIDALSLPPGWLDERGVAVQVHGEVRDVNALALPLALAMATALRKAVVERPIVAAGSATLHGRLEPPADLRARLRSLPAGVLLAVPEGATKGTLDPGRVRTVPNLAAALRAI